MWNKYFFETKIPLIITVIALRQKLKYQHKPPALMTNREIPSPNQRSPTPTVKFPSTELSLTSPHH